MKRGTMTIPAPIANHGDEVRVENYRCRPPCYEYGKVVGLEYRNRWGHEFSWSYEVVLNRRGEKGIIRLYVGDKKLERR